MRSRSLRTLTAIGLALGIVTVIAVSAAIAIGRDDRLAADREAVSRLEFATGDIQERLAAGTVGIQGLLGSSRSAPGDQFARLAEAALASSELSALSYVERVPAASRAAWGREHGFPIHELGGGTVADGEAFPVREAVGTDGTPAIGLDLRSDPEHRLAMSRARDSGMAQATAVGRLIGQERRGVTVYLPVYAGGRDPGTIIGRRRDLQGYVAAAQSSAALSNRLIERLPAGTRFAIEDQSGAPIATSVAAVERDDARTEATTVGRLWSLRADSGPVTASFWPAVIGIVGFGLTLALLLLGGAVRRREDQDLALVLERSLERDVARDAVRRFEDEQAALLRVATAVAADRDVNAVCGLTAAEVAQRAGADRAVVVRLTDEDDVLEVTGIWRCDSGPAPTVGDRITVRPGVGAIPRAMVTRRAARATRAEWDEVGGAVHLDTLGVTVAAPVMIEGRVWGFIAVGAIADRVLASDVEQRLERFAAITALAVTSSEARARLAELASTDPLTGLPNRRAFRDRLAADLERANEEGGALSLAVIDVDHFKRVNDRFGHEVGDRVLAEFAQRLRASARGGETIARVGGEEFAWIIPGCDGADALRAVERLRLEVARHPFPVVGTITASAGVCDLQDANEAGDLFRLADTALYWAKAAGRDRSFRFSLDIADLITNDDDPSRSEAELSDGH